MKIHVIAIFNEFIVIKIVLHNFLGPCESIWISFSGPLFLQEIAVLQRICPGATP